MRPPRSRSRLVLDLLAALEAEGPVGITRLLLVANTTHGRLLELLEAFEAKGWVLAEVEDGRARWRLSAQGARVLADLRRVDAVMQDHGLGL